MSAFKHGMCALESTAGRREDKSVRIQLWEDEMMKEGEAHMHTNSTCRQEDRLQSTS